MNALSHIADVLTRVPARVVPIVPAPRKPVSWADPLPYSGCRLCDFGRDADTLPEFYGDLCHRPETVMGYKRAMPVDAMRVRGGACGPDAKWLTVKGELL
jgi:hypothetical protein